MHTIMLLFTCAFKLILQKRGELNHSKLIMCIHTCVCIFMYVCIYFLYDNILFIYVCISIFYYFLLRSSKNSFLYVCMHVCRIKTSGIKEKTERRQTERRREKKNYSCEWHKHGKIFFFHLKGVSQNKERKRFTLKLKYKSICFCSYHKQQRTADKFLQLLNNNSIVTKRR